MIRWLLWVALGLTYATVHVYPILDQAFNQWVKLLAQT